MFIPLMEYGSSDKENEHSTMLTQNFDFKLRLAKLQKRYHWLNSKTSSHWSVDLCEF